MQPIQPYLIFDGTCREAMTFYQSVLGGELEAMPVSEAGEGMDVPADAGDRLIHACLYGGRAGLMASDSMPGMPVTQGDGVWLYVPCDSDDEVAELFAALGEGGSEVQAPHDAFWGARFAMVNDRFGQHWMLSHDRRGAA